MIRMSAFRYEQVIKELPNPNTYGNSNIAFKDKIKVSILNTPFESPLYLGLPNQTPKIYLDVKEIEFQLKTEYNFYYWSPIEEILITNGK